MLKRLRNQLIPPAVEQRAALLRGHNITYTLKRSKRRRSIGLRIDDEGLTVSVPLRSSDKWLHSVLQDKAHWVIQKLDDWQVSTPIAQRWIDGEEIPYLGDMLELCLVPSMFPENPERVGKQLRLYVGAKYEADTIEQAVSDWYRFQAQELFARRVTHFSSLMKVMPKKVKLSAAKTQWGSCTTKGIIHLNLQLIKLPLCLLDYVVVHELAHIREMNHSAAFWKVVSLACPEYKSLRTELKRVYLGTC